MGKRKNLKHAFAFSMALFMTFASTITANAAGINQDAYNYTTPNVNISGWNTTNPGNWDPYNTDAKKIEISHGDFSLNYDISYSEDGSIRYITQSVSAGDYDYNLDLSMTNLQSMIENKSFEVNGQLVFGYAPAGIWENHQISWKQP